MRRFNLIFEGESMDHFKQRIFAAARRREEVGPAAWVWEHWRNCKQPNFAACAGTGGGPARGSVATSSSFVALHSKRLLVGPA